MNYLTFLPYCLVKIKKNNTIQYSKDIEEQAISHFIYKPLQRSI